MRSEILINRKGVVQSSKSDIAPKGGVSVILTNQEFSITFDDKLTLPALISLIRTLRSASGTMTLSGSKLAKSNLTPQNTFLTIAQLALDTLESETDATFKSQLYLFSNANSDKHDLPEDLMLLAHLNLMGKDVPSALMQVVNANVKNLVSIGQTMSMRLCFLSITKKFSWPDANIEKGDTLDECLPKDAEYWPSILYETAFAVKSSRHHHNSRNSHGNNSRQNTTSLPSPDLPPRPRIRPSTKLSCSQCCLYYQPRKYSRPRKPAHYLSPISLYLIKCRSV